MHVVQRGNNRGPCFFGEADYIGYLQYLACFAEQLGCSVHAYCLMPNHVHLLLTPHRANACAQLMKRLGQCYVQHVNKRIGRTGTLWEGRFYSCLVGSSHYALACYRYIELNPVRAGIVSLPRQYRWSSYQANSAEGACDMPLQPHAAYLSLNDDPDGRMSAYRGLFDSSLETSVADEFRRATRGGYLVGARPSPRGRPRRKRGSDPN